MGGQPEDDEILVPSQLGEPMNFRKIGMIVAFVVALIVSAFVAVSASADTTTVTKGWTNKLFTLDDGRTYYASVPTCTPATDQACIDYLATPRPLITYSHAADVVEDGVTAAATLNNLHAIQANTIFVFSVSANGTKRWDGGICCTAQPVDDVGYLVRIVQQVSANYGINANRVGLMGFSNGGILTERAVCEQPSIFKAGASWAGTFAGDCKVAKVKLAQWHGGDDTVLPLDGGTVTLTGVSYTFPTAESLGTRMLPGSVFSVTVLPGIGHTNPPFSVFVNQVNWLTSQFVG